MWCISDAEVIVGVNKYQLKDEQPIDVLMIDNNEVLKSQVAKLEKLRATRNQEAADACLNKITEIAKTGNGNLLAAAVDAARARCTLGEISLAMEKVFGRHVASDSLVSGAYKSQHGNQKELEVVTQRVYSY